MPEVATLLEAIITKMGVIKPREPLRSLLSVALSCITGKSRLSITRRKTECQCSGILSGKNYRILSLKIA